MEPERRIEAIVITPVSNGYLLQVRLEPELYPLSTTTFIASSVVELNNKILEVFERYG